MIVGCYDLQLYCENYAFNDGVHEYNEMPHCFTGYDRGEAYKKARRAGWRVNSFTDKCYCPKCSGKLANKKDDLPGDWKSVSLTDLMRENAQKGQP